MASLLTTRAFLLLLKFDCFSGSQWARTRQALDVTRRALVMPTQEDRHPKKNLEKSQTLGLGALSSHLQMPARLEQLASSRREPPHCCLSALQTLAVRRHLKTQHNWIVHSHSGWNSKQQTQPTAQGLPVGSWSLSHPYLLMPVVH